MHKRQQSGFSLIELMIVVLVVAILTAIAVPSYRQYLIRTHRSAAQSQMMEIANRQQQFLLANRRYASTLAELNYTLPSGVSERYGCTLNVPSPAQFTLTCTPTGTQAGDCNLTLNHAGAKTPADKWKG